MATSNSKMAIVVVEDDSTIANTADNWHPTQHVHRRPNVHTNTPPPEELESDSQYGGGGGGEALLLEASNADLLSSSSADLRFQNSSTVGAADEEVVAAALMYELPSTAVLKHLLQNQSNFFAKNKAHLPDEVLVGMNGGGRQPSSAAVAMQTINNQNGKKEPSSSAAATAIYMAGASEDNPRGHKGYAPRGQPVATPHTFEFSVEMVGGMSAPRQTQEGDYSSGDLLLLPSALPISKATERSQLIAGSVVPSRFLRKIRTQWDSRKELQELLIRFRESITCIHAHATTHFHLWEEALYEIYSVTGSTRSKIRARLPKRAWQRAREKQQQREREERRLQRIKEGTWLYSAEEEDARLQAEKDEQDNPPLPDAEHVERASKLFERAIRRCGDIFEELATHMGGFGDRFIQLMRMINAEVAAIDWLNSFEDMLEIFETRLQTFHNDSLLDFAMEVPPMAMDGAKLTVSELNCFSAEAKRDRIKTNEVIPKGMAISLKSLVNYEEGERLEKERLDIAAVAAAATATAEALAASSSVRIVTNTSPAHNGTNKRSSSATPADGALERKPSSTGSEISMMGRNANRGSRKGLDSSMAEGRPPRRASASPGTSNLGRSPPQAHAVPPSSSGSHTNSPPLNPGDATPPPAIPLASSVNTSASTSFSATATATTLKTGVVQNRHLAALDTTSAVVAQNQKKESDKKAASDIHINRSKHALLSALPYKCDIVASCADHTDPYLRTLYIATSSGAVLSVPFSSVTSMGDGASAATTKVENKQVSAGKVKAAIAKLLVGYPHPMPMPTKSLLSLVPTSINHASLTDPLNAFDSSSNHHRRSSVSDLASNDNGPRRSATKRNSASGNAKDPKAAAKSERQRRQEEAAAAIAAEKEAALAAANAIKAEAAARLPIKAPPQVDPKVARPTFIDGVRLFEGHMFDVHLLEYIPAGGIVVSASRDKTMRLHDAASGKLVNVIADLTGLPSSVCYHRDLEAIIVGSYSGEIIMLDIKTKGAVGRMKLSQPIHSLCFDAVLSVLFVGTRKGHVYGFKLSLDPQHYRPRLEPIDDAGQQQDCVYCFLPNATDPLAYPIDRSTCTITVQSGDHNTDSTNNGSVVAVSSPLNSQPPRIGTGPSDAKNSVSLNAAVTKMVSVAFYLFVGDAVGRVQQWDLASGEYVRKYHAHSDDITDIIVTVDGILFTSSKDALVVIWSIIDGSRLKVVNRHYAGVSGMFVGYLGGAHTPDGQEETRETIQLPPISKEAATSNNKTSRQSIAAMGSSTNSVPGASSAAKGGDQPHAEGANPATSGHGFNIFTHRRLNGTSMFEEDGPEDGDSSAAGGSTFASPQRAPSASGSRNAQHSPVTDSRVVPSAPVARPFLMIPGYEDQPTASEAAATATARPNKGANSKSGTNPQHPHHPNAADVGLALLKGEVPPNVDMKTLLGSRECVRVTVHNPPVLVTTSMDESIITWAVQYAD